MAFPVMAALSLGTNLAGSLFGANSAAKSQEEANRIARDALQNSINQQGYQRALNAIALQRSTASTSDGRGSTTVYDPATNTWRADLSKSAHAIQNASDQSTISRNTTDVATAQDANRSAIARAIAAREASGPALAAVKNFRPMSAAELEGGLQETSTVANRAAQQPIIADTLRQFARQGTAAGPVLAQMMRSNGDSLRTSMVDNKLSALKNVGSINNNNMTGLQNRYSQLNNAANPQLQFAPLANNSPNDALASSITQRAAGAAQPASMASYGVSSGTNAVTNAAGLAAKSVGGGNTGAIIASLGGQINDAFRPGGALMNYFNPPEKTATQKQAYDPNAADGFGGVGGFSSPWSSFGNITGDSGLV